MPEENYNIGIGHGILLVPQKPCVRTIIFENGDGSLKNVRLSFPHTLFSLVYCENNGIFTLKKLYVSFGKEPFSGDVEEKLFGLPMRNHDESFATCFGEWPTAENEEELIEKTIQQYWTSPFAEYNDWASAWTNKYINRHPTFLKEWIKQTKNKNFDWIFNKDFIAPDYVVNIQKLLEVNKSYIAKLGVKVIQK